MTLIIIGVSWSNGLVLYVVSNDASHTRANPFILAYFLGPVLISFISLITLAIAQKTIANPLKKLNKDAETIAKGDLSIRIEKSSKTDEISSLQNTFVAMIQFLSPMVHSMSNSSTNIASSSQELASSSEEVNASIEELSSISQQISNGAQQQSDFLHKSKINLDGIQKDFSEKINDIKLTSQVIENISSQVNMLALNASIEAARAGEYGRGFAVVADNIRRLADDAKTSVNSVNNVIEELIKSIALNMGNLSSRLTSVITLAEETAMNAEMASASTEEQSATMEELSASAQELAKISLNLEDIVQQFKME